MKNFAIAIFLLLCVGMALATDFTSPLVFDGIKGGHFLFHRNKTHIKADCVGGGGPTDPANEPNGMCRLAPEIGDAIQPLGSVDNKGMVWLTFSLSGSNLNIYERQPKDGKLVYVDDYRVIEEEVQ